MVNVTDDLAVVLKQGTYDKTAAKTDLRVVYTPLHGTGDVSVQSALHLDGSKHMGTVVAQSVPDGSSPTVVSPNPEDRRALGMGIAQARETEADIVFGTDPDCDRVGIAVRTVGGDYQLMAGNQVGILLMGFVLTHSDLSKYPHPAVVKNVVTSELGAEIAKKHGITVFSTLT